MRSSKLIIKSVARKVMANFDFGCSFHELEYFEAGIFLIFLEFIINLRAPLQKKLEKHRFYKILSCFKKLVDHHMLDNIFICTLFAPSSKICRLFLDFFWAKYIVGFVDHCVFQMLWFIPSQNSKLAYNVESLSLKPMQGNGVVHLTVLAPGKEVSLNQGWSAGYKILLGEAPWLLQAYAMYRHLHTNMQ